MGLRRISILHTVVVTISLALPMRAATAPAPGIGLTATNVSMGDRSTGTSQFTLTSLNGFSGQVLVLCPNRIPSLQVELPVCAPGLQTVTLQANGTTNGSVELIPPWQSSARIRSNPSDRPGDRPGRMPLAACGSLALGALFLRKRRGWLRILLSFVLAAAGLAASISISGCIGQGGIAMTPGTYHYSINVESLSGVLLNSADVKVTIHE